MTPIRQAPIATDPELQALILGNLSETSLQGMMAEKAKAQDLGWLSTMIEGDLLGVEEEVQRLHLMDKQGDPFMASLGMHDLSEKWSQRACALTRFMENIGFAVGAQAGSINICKAVYGPDQGADAKFKGLFTQGVQRLVASYHALVPKQKSNEVLDQSHDLVDAMAHWLAAACAIDLPEQVRALITACPQAINTRLPMERLGPVMLTNFEENLPEQDHDDEQTDHPPPTAEVTPFFVALQLSRIECMQAMVQGNQDSLLGKFSCHGQTHTVFPHELYKMTSPLCSLQALTQALVHQIKNGADQPATYRNNNLKGRMFDSGIDIIESEMPRMRPHLLSYLDAGVMDLDPVTAIRSACTNGEASVVKHFLPSMPWQGLKETFGGIFSPVYMAVCRSKNDNESAEHEEVITLLLGQAIKDDQADLVLQTFVVKNPRSEPRIEPLFTLVEEGWSDAVVKFLDHGFDPHAKTPGGTLSLLDLANDKAPGVANIIHSHQARQKARALLSEMDAPTNTFSGAAP